MKEVTIAEVQASLTEYLELAEAEDILITNEGKPVGLLIGFESEADWADFQVEHDPRFLHRIATARQRLRSGHGIPLEKILWD